jgi:exodeoxyribonuclease VII small subunit
MNTKNKKNLIPDSALCDKGELSFEDALLELEKTIEELERDDLTLEKALRFFERGIGLMRNCDSHLKSAQGKIQELLKGENGTFVEKVLGNTLESFLNREDAE